MNDLNLMKRIRELETQLMQIRNVKFGLIFEDKAEDVVDELTRNIPYLKELTERRVNSNDSKNNNILIEGDNYQSLAVLNYTHKAKIDLIYIDPPYNTGARDWKYNNDYVDSEDTYRHTKWLSFMKHRLNVASNLLKENGFIIVAIDHNELFTLGVLMDSIFGEQNRIGIVTVVHKPEGRNQEKFFGTSNEFMLVYAKNKSKANFNKVVLDDELQGRFDLVDSLGSYRLKNFIRLTDGKYSLRENKPKFFYPIYVSKDLTKFSLEEIKGGYLVTPTTEKGVERTWKTTKETFMKLTSEGSIVAKIENNVVNIYEKLREDQVIKTHWIKKEYHGYHFGTKLLENILGEKKFDFPKSLNLMIDILKLTTRKDSIVLDFFAGSGTTGHAVLELNKADGGNRQFILCTNNENNKEDDSGGIVESVCYPRLKNVIQGYGNNGKELKEALGGNLFYFKVELLDVANSYRLVDEEKIALAKEMDSVIALRENTLHKIEQNEFFTIYQNDNQTLGIYYLEDKSHLPDLIQKIEHEVNPKLYIFSWSKGEYISAYPSQNLLVDEIPSPFLGALKELA